MVSQLLFYYRIKLRLIEIFGVTKPFGGLSVIVCADFYQLLPVNPTAIYSQFNLKKATVKDIKGLELWYLLKITELTKCIKKKFDTRLIEIRIKIKTCCTN